MPLSYLLRGMAFIFLCGGLTFSAEQDWTQFRGPMGVGSSTATGLPASWSAEKNVAWKTPLPGPGASSPIVWDDQVFVTCYSGYGEDEKNPGDPSRLTLHVVGIDLGTGKIAWNSRPPVNSPEQPYRGFINLHGYASSTPATDGRAVYAFFGRSGIFAYDMTGGPLWTLKAGENTHGFGTANSVVLYRDLAIVNASVESGALVAVDKYNGTEVWRAEGIRRSWNTPHLVHLENGNQELVVNSEGSLLGFDPESGEELWRCDGIDDYICPSVISHEGVVYAIGGRGHTAMAVRAGGRGDVSDSHLLWRINRGSNVSSPVFHEGYLYYAHEQQGIVYCIDAEGGDTVYQERLTPSPGRIYASPTVADGHIYLASREGGCYVLAAKPEFELLAHNDLEDESVFNASPVVCADGLLLRSDDFLYCISE